MKKSVGFTLVELLVVIAIIAILATVVFVALNPVGRFADARDSRRWNDVNNYLTALNECIVDNDGSTSTCLVLTTTPTPVAGNTYEIVTSATSGCDDVCTSASSDTSCIKMDITPMQPYLKSLPTDPGGVTSGHTEYSFSIDANNIITISACSAENATINVSR